MTVWYTIDGMTDAVREVKQAIEKHSHLLPALWYAVTEEVELEIEATDCLEPLGRELAADLAARLKSDEPGFFHRMDVLTCIAENMKERLAEIEDELTTMGRLASGGA